MAVADVVEASSQTPDQVIIGDQKAKTDSAISKREQCFTSKIAAEKQCTEKFNWILDRSYYLNCYNGAQSAYKSCIDALK